MNPARLRRVEEVFSSIAGLPQDARNQALLDACGGDRELFAEVGSLLRHADPPDSFLSNLNLPISVNISGPAPVVDDMIGQRIGPFLVTQRRASGGMGTVYRAIRDDGQYEQQVAIKVVKRGMDTDQILRYFSAERRNLASLRHPNIAQLLDAGALPDGRPYLVMEYVQGIPITEYCELHRLALQERLRLFCIVGEAVRSAHQKLVVHRDLKPGNILVDELGNPKLLDFGVSKVLDSSTGTDVTTIEERRFTPDYASPEQVAGEPLSTASDVYSLGLVLFEMLTGQRPYHLANLSVSEIIRIVREVELSPPSMAVRRLSPALDSAPTSPSSPGAAVPAKDPLSQRLSRQLKGDLDTIVLKAARKDPARRYESVEQLLADIGRYLSGRPVLARPDSILYRTGKYLRRNAVAVGLGTAALLLLSIGLGTAIWQGRIARMERDAAYVARDQAEATADYLQRAFAAADTATAIPGVGLGAFLDAVTDRVKTDLQSQPLVEAAVRSTLGRMYLGLGLMDKAEANIRAAADARAKLLPVGHHDRAESEFDLARLYSAQGHFEEAERLLRDCLAIHIRLRGSNNLDTARVLTDLETVLRAMGKDSEADAAFQQAEQIRKQIKRLQQ